MPAITNLHRWIVVATEQYVDLLFERKNMMYLKGLAIACREHEEWTGEVLEETFDIFVLDALESAMLEFHRQPPVAVLKPVEVLHEAKKNPFLYDLMYYDIQKFCKTATEELAQKN